jgi:hypothetical protein
MRELDEPVRDSRGSASYSPEPVSRAEPTLEVRDEAGENLEDGTHHLRRHEYRAHADDRGDGDGRGNVDMDGGDGMLGTLGLGHYPEDRSAGQASRAPFLLSDFFCNFKGMKKIVIEGRESRCRPQSSELST